MASRIVITRPLPGDPVGLLAEAGLDDAWVNPDDASLSRAALLEVIRGTAAVIATPAETRVDAEFLDAAGPTLRIVANYAVGFDNVDLAETARRHVLVTNTPDAVTECTADIAWLLVLGAARRVPEAHRALAGGTWPGVGPLQLLGRRLVEKTLLLVGAGRIATAVARRARGWRMRVLYHARSRHPDIEVEPFAATRVSLDEGLAEADFVSLHCPLTDETHHLIGARELDLMKPTAVLVNTSRGPVVDESALAEALRSGAISAAGLDVYEHEPIVHPGLLALDNAFLLPHLGSATHEDRSWMTRTCVENVVAALGGKDPPNLVGKR